MTKKQTPATETAPTGAPPQLPDRLKWLVTIHDPAADLRYNDPHVMLRPFLQQLDGDLWFVSTDGRTLVAVRALAAEVEGMAVENLLTSRKATKPSTKRPDRPTRKVIEYLDVPDAPTLTTPFVPLLSFVLAGDPPPDRKCPLCCGTGDDPHVDANEAARRLKLDFDEGDFEYDREVDYCRVLGVLLDRTRLKEALGYLDAEVCNVHVSDFEPDTVEPVLMYADDWRVLVMPMRDDDADMLARGRDECDNFPLVEYAVTQTYNTREGDPLDEPTPPKIGVLKLALAGTVGDSTYAPVAVTVKYDPDDLLLPYRTGELVQLTRDAGGRWHVPTLWSATVEVESEVQS